MMNDLAILHLKQKISSEAHYFIKVFSRQIHNVDFFQKEGWYLYEYTHLIWTIYLFFNLYWIGLIHDETFADLMMLLFKLVEILFRILFIILFMFLVMCWLYYSICFPFRKIRLLFIYKNYKIFRINWYDFRMDWR